MSGPAGTLVKDGKAFLRDRDDNLYTVDDPKAAEALIAHGDRFPVTAEHLREHERKKKSETLGAQLKTGAESFAASAIDAAQAPIALPIRAGAALLGKGDPLKNISGRATVENAATLFGDLNESLGLTDQTGESYGREYGENARERAEANPLTALGGNVAGALAVGGALSGGVGAIGGAASRALGGGLAARAAGAVTAGALEGAAYGQAQAAEEAYLQNIPLSAEKLIASMGWGAVLGGGVSLAAHGAGSLLRRGARKAEGAAEAAAEHGTPLDAGLSAADDIGKGATAEARTATAEARTATAEAEAASAEARAAAPKGEALPTVAAEVKPAAGPLPDAPPVAAAPEPVAMPGEPLPTPAAEALPMPAAVEGVAGKVEPAAAAAIAADAAAAAPLERAAAAVKESGVLRELATDAARKALGSKNAKALEKLFSGTRESMLEGARALGEHYSGELIGSAVGGIVGGPLGAVVGGIASKLLERHTGQLAVNVAERLAHSLDGKIDQGLGAFFRESTARAQATATGLGKAAPVPIKRMATPSAVDAFQGKAPDLQAAYDERVRQLTDATRELGAGARAATLQAMGGAADTMPRLTAAATGTATRGAQYLESQLPSGTKAPTMFQPSRKYSPSDLQIREFAQKWSAVANPLSVIDDLRRGTVTHAQIDALKNVYPELYSEVRIKTLEKVRAVDESGQRLPLNDRLTLDLFLDLGGAGEPTLAPGFVDRMTEIQASKAKQIAEGTPGSSGAGLDKIGKSRVSGAQSTFGQG